MHYATSRTMSHQGLRLWSYLLRLPHELGDKLGISRRSVQPQCLPLDLPRASTSTHSNSTISDSIAETSKLVVLPASTVRKWYVLYRICLRVLQLVKQGEARHAPKKRQYARTNKRAHEAQIAQQTIVLENMRLIDAKVAAARGEKSAADISRDKVLVQESDVIGDAKSPYIIAKTASLSVSFSCMVGANRSDPAMTVKYQCKSNFELILMANLVPLALSSPTP